MVEDDTCNANVIGVADPDSIIEDDTGNGIDIELGGQGAVDEDDTGNQRDTEVADRVNGQQCNNYNQQPRILDTDEDLGNG